MKNTIVLARGLLISLSGVFLLACSDSDIENPSNNPGSVAINGDTFSGATLAASVSDEDGVNTSSLTYAWSADGSAIAGENSGTLELSDALVGTRISILVTYTDDGGVAESVGATLAADINPTLLVSATFSKGIVTGGTCSLFAVSEDGTVATEALATATTNALGVADFSDIHYAGPALVTCSGGSYVDEATGESRTPPVMRAVVDTTTNTSPVITPLTEIAVQNAEAEADADVGILTALTTHNMDNSLGIDVTAVVPTDLESSAAEDDDAGKYATLLAVVSQLAATEGAETVEELAELFAALGNDEISDQDIADALDALANSSSNAASNIPQAILDIVTQDLELQEPVNSVGTVSIEGAAVVGETLSASLSDSNGVESAVLSFQWTAAGVDIDSATASTLVLTDNQLGAVIAVSLSYTDDDGFDESLLSAATAAVVANVVNVEGSVSILGTAQVGELLTASVSDSNGTSTSSIAYQWHRAGADIADATTSNYSPIEADVGASLSVSVTYTDDDGFGESLTSPETSVVVVGAVNTEGVATVTGTAEVGEMLVAGLTDDNGTANATLLYQWQADQANILGANSDTYTLVSTDIGAAIRVNITYTDDDGFSEDVNSPETAAVIDSGDDVDRGQVASITDTVTNDTGELRYDLSPGQTVGSFSASIFIPEGETAPTYLTLYDSNADLDNDVMDINFLPAGNSDFTCSENCIASRTDDGDRELIDGATYNQGEWLDVQLTWNTTTVSFYLNDALIGTFDSQNPGAEVSRPAVRFAYNSGIALGALLVDDFRIASDEAGNTEVFFDDFEDYALPYFLTDGIDTPYHDRTFSAEVIDTSDGDGDDRGNIAAIASDGALRYTHSSGLTVGKFAVSVLYSTDETNEAYVTLYDADDDIIDLKIKSGGRFELRGDEIDFDFPEPAFTPGEWMDVEITWDVSSGTFGLTVDGIVYGTDFPLIETTGLDVVSVAVRANSNAVSILYADDFALYSDQAGTTSVFTEGFENYSVDHDLSSAPFDADETELATVVDGSGSGGGGGGGGLTFELSGTITNPDSVTGQWELSIGGNVVNSGDLSAGSVTYSSSIADGAFYEIAFDSVSNGTCSVSDDTGTVTEDISDLNIDCVASVGKDYSDYESWGSDDSVPAISCDSVLNSEDAIEDTIDTDMDAGTTICIADGTYGDINLTFGGLGTIDDPVTVAAENPGNVVFDGEVKVAMTGEYVVLQGIIFQGGESASSDFLQTRGSRLDVSNTPCHFCRITEIAVIDLDVGDDGSGKWLNIYGHHNRIDHNWFAGKSNTGPMLIINREAADNAEDTEVDYAQIDHNYFGDRAPAEGKAYADSGDNDYEAIRTGTSDSHAFDSFSVVENNYFERIDAEAEVISNKAGNNSIRNNTVRDSYGSITTRHGSSATIANNFIFGDGHPFAAGFRIIDDGHRVVNNYVEGARYLDTLFHGGIVVHNSDGSTSNGYQDVENVLIAHNTIVDSVNSLNFHGSREDDSPEDVYFVNNIVADAVGPVITNSDEGMPGGDSTYAGNYVDNRVDFSDGDLDSFSGFTAVDAELVEDGIGVSRPDALNLVDLSAADVSSDIGDFEVVEDDMDGQVRSFLTTSGADEESDDGVIYGVLTSGDVGPINYTPEKSQGFVFRQNILNYGFDEGGEDWELGAEVSITNDEDEYFARGASVIIEGIDSSVSQDLDIEADTNYRLTAFTKGPIQLGANLGAGEDTSTSVNYDDYHFTSHSFHSGDSTSVVIYAEMADEVTNYIDVPGGDFADFEGDDSDENWIVVEGTGIGSVEATSDSASGATDSGGLKFRWRDDGRSGGVPSVTQHIEGVVTNTDVTLSVYVQESKDSSANAGITIGVYEGATTNVLYSEFISPDNLEAEGVEQGQKSYYPASFDFNTADNESLTIFVEYDSDGSFTAELRVDEISLSYHGAPEGGSEAFVDEFRLVSYPGPD